MEKLPGPVSPVIGFSTSYPASFRADWTARASLGLKVSKSASNMPWNRPILASPFAISASFARYCRPEPQIRESRKTRKTCGCPLPKAISKNIPDQGGSFLPVVFCLLLPGLGVGGIGQLAEKWRETRGRGQNWSKTAGCMALETGVEGLNQGGRARISSQKVLLPVHDIGRRQVFDRICKC
jgi:hypothetical protein